MQTQFSKFQLADPLMAASEDVIRKCVHCGFCLATCPTYVLLGDELDSPRGRIYLIKDMLENERAPTADVVTHIDRCLSCLSCMTTCPSDVNYMRLIDHARNYVENNYRRPLSERCLRTFLSFILPYPRRFRAVLKLGSLFKFMAVLPLPQRLRAMLQLAPAHLPSPASMSSAAAGKQSRRGRVILFKGCVESVLAPQIRDASVRLLNRAGFDVVFSESEGCCGALVHHMGKHTQACAFAKRNVDAWLAECDSQAGLDAIVITASGCGSVIKDYEALLGNDPVYAPKWARLAPLVKDISEFLAQAGLPRATNILNQTVAYQAACSLKHGQKLDQEPKQLLREAGFQLREPDEAHLCCGSAGTYNILQPEIAASLRERKLQRLMATGADIIASGNIGCMTQLANDAGLAVVHVVELLDWAHGGVEPAQILKQKS